MHALLILFNFFLLIDLCEREREINFLFHFFMHSLVGSCTCHDRVLNPNLGVLGQHSNQLSYWPRLYALLIKQEDKHHGKLSLFLFAAQPMATWPVVNHILLLSSFISSVKFS